VRRDATAGRRTGRGPSCNFAGSFRRRSPPLEQNPDEGRLPQQRGGDPTTSCKRDDGRIRRAIIASAPRLRDGWAHHLPPHYVPLDEDHPFPGADPVRPLEVVERADGAEMFCAPLRDDRPRLPLHWMSPAPEARARRDESGPSEKEATTSGASVGQSSDAAQAASPRPGGDLAVSTRFNIIAADTSDPSTTDALLRAQWGPTTRGAAPLPGNGPRLVDREATPGAGLRTPRNTPGATSEGPPCEANARGRWPADRHD
jgi:hypothetical protein